MNQEMNMIFFSVKLHQFRLAFATHPVKDIFETIQMGVSEDLSSVFRDEYDVDVEMEYRMAAPF